MDIIKWCKGGGLLLVLAFGAVQGDPSASHNHLFLPGTEAIYAWTAKLTAGAALPQSVSLSWDFNATVIIQQTMGNTTVYKITDIKTSELKTETRPLTLPFRTTYAPGGLLAGIALDPLDRRWSVNIKRALATLVQLDLNSLQSQSAFMSEENGMYGVCSTQYLVSSWDEGGAEDGQKLSVRKVVDMDSCLLPGRRPHRWSSAPAFICPNKYQKEVTSHSERTYAVDFGADVLIRKVNAKGKISLQPYQSQAEAHYSLVKQSLILVKSGRTVEPIFAEAGEDVDSGSAGGEESELLWQPVNLDPTYGKPPTNKSAALLKEIQSMLAEASDSLSWWKVRAQGLHNETLFRLVDLMWWLDADDWEALYATVTLGTSYRQETTQQIFWELVPEVGSAPSTVFVKDLVRSGRVKGLNAVFLLGRFPFRLREPTEELLFQCEDLLRLGDVGEEVKNSAVLSFATMIHKTCAVNCKTDTLDRYAKLFLDRFKESTLHGDRMLYLQALSNMDLPQILDYLTPVITGKMSGDRHLRFLSIWAVMQSAFTNPGKVYETFWPILSNRTESLEIRVASLTLLIVAKPTPAGLISLFWFMQAEPSDQLYQFYYTTVQSLTQTTYPCYTHLGVVASQLARFVRPRWSHGLATANYILDYEEPDRGYGGLLQMLMIGSERTGLPNVMILVAEQHALGLTTEHALYVKLNGLGEALRQVSLNKSNEEGLHGKARQVLEALGRMGVPDRADGDGEDVHMEFILKADGRTVATYYINGTNFHNLTNVVRRLSSLYFEFSVNYQRLTFPLALLSHQPTDFGVTALSQVRFSSFVSARGRLSQDEQGVARDAELDLRYSWNGITSLRVFSPLSNTWYGADRSRSVHARLPFATHIDVDFAKAQLKITAIKHRDFVAGTQIGGVWHSMTKIISGSTATDPPHNITDEWTMDSEDLGARLGASVFDCPGETLGDALHLLKRAFLAKNKNYHMVPGGIALLGLFSLRDQLAFQPPGGTCGLMLSFIPLLNQVEPVLLFDVGAGHFLSLSMQRKDGRLWEIQAGVRQLHDGNREAAFKLYHAPTVSSATAVASSSLSSSSASSNGLSSSSAGFWRVIQLEGAFIIPSRKSGVLQPPAPLTGYTFASWGDALPGNSDRAAVLDIKVIPAGDTNPKSAPSCTDFRPSCLQAFTDLAAPPRQTATVQYLNLPGWFKTAAHALFPEHFQTESTSTRFTFNSPLPFPPWNTKGLCAISRNAVLTFDNATLSVLLPDRYAVGAADCSGGGQFAVLTKNVPGADQLAVRLVSGPDEVEILPSTGNMSVLLNGRQLSETDYAQPSSDTSSLNLVVSVKENGMVEVEAQTSGVLLQHYSATVVLLVPGSFRGATCGLCGDFNSDTNNDTPGVRTLYTLP